MDVATVLRYYSIISGYRVRRREKKKKRKKPCNAVRCYLNLGSCVGLCLKVIM